MGSLTCSNSKHGSCEINKVIDMALFGDFSQTTYRTYLSFQQPLSFHMRAIEVPYSRLHASGGCLNPVIIQP